MKILLGILIHIIWFESVYMCIRSICSKKICFNFKKSLFIISIALINYFVAVSGIIVFRAFISFLTILLITKFILKEGSRNCLVCTLVYYILVAVAKVIFSIFFVCILKSNPLKYVSSISFSKMITCTIIMHVLALISKTKFVRKLYKKVCNMVDTLKVRSEFILIIIIMMSIVLSFYVLNIVGSVKFLYTVMYLIIFLIFILYFFVSLYQNYYLRILNKYFIEKENEYQRLLDEYKMFKHNIKHELCLLKSVNDKESKKIISAYINEYSTDEAIENIVSLPNSLRATIYKKAIFNNNNIKVIVDSYVEEDPINVLSLKRFVKMVESIGIIVDNAYESATSKPKNYVYIYFSEDDTSYSFKCFNSLNNDIIDIDSIGEKGQSSKDGHQGIGMYYIKNKTDFKLTNCITDNMFVSELLIKK